MGDDSKVKDAAEIVKGIVEHVPVYQDLVQPAVKEVGTALQTVAKTVHIALAPVSALVWGYDQIKDWVQKTVTEKLKDVPPEEIIPPRVAIAGPTIEALRFTADEPILRELYANLLATSMTSGRRDKAHPAFVDIIKQMEVIDVHVLNIIYQHYKSWCGENDLDDEQSSSPIEHSVAQSMIRDELSLGRNAYEKSIDNLIRVRCVAPFVEERGNELDIANTIDYRYYEVCITSFGVSFVEACTNQVSK